MITIPQLRNTGAIFMAILIVSGSLGLSNAYMHGEVKHWSDLKAAALDSLLPAIGIAVGWIALKSPLSREVTGLLTQESTKVTESPSGATVTERTTTSLQVEKKQ